MIAIALLLAFVFSGSGDARVFSHAAAQSNCGDTILAGSSWLNGGGVDVKSNGPKQGTGVDCSSQTSVVNGVVAGEEWQCPELVNRLYLTKGWIHAPWHGNGDEMFDMAPASLSKEPNGSITYVAPGDVVSINEWLNGAPQTGGHVAIVNTNGRQTSGQVALISQNGGNTGDPGVSRVWTLTDGSLTRAGSGGWTYAAVGVVHAPFSGGSGGALSATTPLALSSPGGLKVYQPINFSFTIKNVSGSAASIQRVEVAVRDPGNQPVDKTCTSGTGLSLAAGASWACNASATTGFGSPGTYTYWADWLDYGGNWHTGQLSSTQSFTLAPTSQTLAAAQPISMSAPGGLKVYQPLQFSFQVLNVSGSAASIKDFRVPIRGPGAQGLDLQCADGTGVALAAGAQWTCSASTSTGFTTAGTYTYWADWEGYDNRWHTGELGPMQTFTLQAAPQAFVIATPLAMTAPSGLKVNAPLQFSFTASNVSGSAVLVRSFRVPIRDPNGLGLDLLCSGGTNVSVRPTAHWTCSASTTGLALPGTYTYWADWEGTDGSWHQGQLGPNQTFTLPAPPAPQISSFTPTSGSPGTVVTISGANFASVSAVHVGGATASYTVKSPTSILATAPSSATSGAITVATPGGTATSAGNFTVIPLPPRISSFTPTHGSAGVTVTISGTHLSDAASVAFNGVAAAGFTVLSDTAITAVVPGNASSGKLTVKTPGGAATSAGVFTFLPPYTVTAVAASTSVSPNQSFTITGLVSPAAAGEKVTLQTGLRSSWTNGSQATVISKSEYSFTVSESGAGSFRFRVEKAAFGGHALGDSPEIDVQVNGSTLTAGNQLIVGQYLTSPESFYRLELNPDGNLSLMVGSSGRSIWSSGTPGHANAIAVMQTDGNFVLYDANGAYWSSSTGGHTGSYFAVQDDGNLVVYPPSGAGLWSTGSVQQDLYGGEKLMPGESIYSQSRAYQLFMQTDGNLVLYQQSSGALWSSGTTGHAGAHAVMQTDGNLVVYTPGGVALWESGTDGQGGAHLIVQNDGNTVIYSSSGSALWSTNTASGGSSGGGGGPVDDYPTSIAGCIPLSGGPPFTCDLKDSAQDSVFDPWREYNRECTSFVAWRLYSRNGFWMPFHDYAENWGARAKSLSYVVDTNPRVGSVAWKSTGNINTGHVAWVEAVTGNNVTVEEYNADFLGHYKVETLAKSYFTGYIHFKDLP